MNGKIQYLNTDLVLVSSEELTPLATALEAQGVVPLFVEHDANGVWHASFETMESFDEPDANLAAMLDAIESLSPDLRTIWDACSRREFNIGYDCGEEPWAFQQGLRCEILGRMAAVGASLYWTLYPDRPEAVEPLPAPLPDAGPPPEA